jgi:hypothetical protein
MKIIDRIFAWILVIGGVLHGWGSCQGYRHEPIIMLWALCATLLTLLIAAVNLLRVERSGDRPLAWICFAGSLSWAIAAFAFGVLIHNIFDPRPLTHYVTALVLAGFSLKAALKPGTVKA